MSVIVGKFFDPGAVYIGRANARAKLCGSPLANPFVIGRDGPREMVIQRYRDWLSYHLSFRGGPERLELLRLVALAGQGDLTLGCYCAPLPCHGDVIKECIEAELEGKSLIFCPGESV